MDDKSTIFHMYSKWKKLTTEKIKGINKLHNYFQTENCNILSKRHLKIANFFLQLSTKINPPSVFQTTNA